MTLYYSFNLLVFCRLFKCLDPFGPRGHAVNFRPDFPKIESGDSIERIDSFPLIPDFISQSISFTASLIYLCGYPWCFRHLHLCFLRTLHIVAGFGAWFADWSIHRVVTGLGPNLRDGARADLGWGLSLLAGLWLRLIIALFFLDQLVVGNLYFVDAACIAISGESTVVVNRAIDWICKFFELFLYIVIWRHI